MGHSFTGGNAKRNRAAAVRAYALKQSGWTTRQIAEDLGIKPEQVRCRVKLGERFHDTSEQENGK